MKIKSIATNLFSRIAINLILIILISQSAIAAPIGEVEPNNSLLQANILFPGQIGHGNISSGAEFDGWQIPNVHTDEFFCVLLNAIEAAPSGNDPVLSAYFNVEIDDTSKSDYYNDDGGPPSDGFRDSMLCGEAIKRSGSIFFRVDGFGSSTLEPYDLYQVVVAPNEVLPEVEPNDSVATAMPIQSPAIAANLSADGDVYSFYANAGERIVVMIDQNPGRPTPASNVATSLKIIDSDGVTDLTESVAGEHLNGTNQDGNAVAYGALPAPHAGTYYIQVTKAVASGADITPDGDYRIILLVDGASPATGACCQKAACALSNATNCHGKFGGIGTVCGGDIDNDGIADGCDNCAAVSNDAQEDKDADEVGDVCDTCATDKLKVNAGACGCGTKDIDSDGDGTADCNDQCPSDARESVPGACGCGVIEADSNGNGVFDCLVGEDVKTSLRTYLATLNSKLAAIKSKKPSKAAAAAITADLNLIQAAILAGGNQVVVNKSGFSLNTEATKLSLAVKKTLASSAKRLKKNKTESIKQLQAIIGALS